MNAQRVHRVCAFIDRVSAAIGGGMVALLVLPLLYVVCHEVVARYVWGAPTDWAYDLTYMLYGALFMLGGGYTLLHGGHIRSDIFYRRWSVRRRGMVDAALYLLLFFPAMAVFFGVSLQEAVYSFTINERSDATLWRPPLTPFKATVPLAVALLLWQGVSEFLKSLYAAVHGAPLPEQ